MRTTTIPAKTVTEAIQSVDYQVGIYVQVLIGTGSEINGTFEFDKSQVYEVVRIMDAPEVLNKETGEVIRPANTTFSDLNAQYPNGSFSLDDLWPYIDRIRAAG